jgi:hypothetical protein
MRLKKKNRKKLKRKKKRRSDHERPPGYQSTRWATRCLKRQSDANVRLLFYLV